MNLQEQFKRIGGKLTEARDFKAEAPKIANWLYMEFDKARDKLRAGYKNTKEEQKVEKALNILEKATKNLVKTVGTYTPFKGHPAYKKFDK